MKNSGSITAAAAVGIVGMLLGGAIIALGLFVAESGGMIVFGLLVGGGGIGASALINKYS